MKELVERVSGVPAATQRLLCRGRVLSDDASMESARVEDGDTLLLVKRAPETSGGGDPNPALANDPHAPENAERGGGRGGTIGNGGAIGDLSRMITSLLTSNPGMLGAAMGAGGGAVTVEFSIANGGDGTNAERGGTEGRPGGPARGGGGRDGVNGETVVTRAPEETLRRYVGAVERVMNDVRERRSQPLVTNAAAAAARNRPGAAATPTTEATTEDGRVETIHYGVQCDTCDVNPVRGTRYKSVAHDDFDLCATCFAAGFGSQCGPFTRLDLPLPAGLPPVIHHENSEPANANERTPGEQSEAGIAALGQLVRAANAVAANAAPLMDNVAGRYEPASRQNTVETQAQGLQLAAVMHAVGSLWCELARCISVVPPPPDAMTPEGAAVAGDDINGTRSLFNYPRPSYIASNGEFPHTRPPGMPLHTQANNFAGFAQQARAAGQTPGVMHVVHHVPSGPNGLEGLDQLPPEIRALMMRQAEANQNQAAPGSQTSTEASDSPAAGQPPQQSAQRGRARRQAQAHSSQRMLSRLLGTVFRAIPSPSFMGPQTGANGSQAQAGQQTATQPGATEAAPPTPAAPSVEPPAAQPTREEAPPSRSRMRSETNEDTNDRAAKASNTGNGLSPAASAAHFATREADTEAAKSTLGNSSQAAGTSRDERAEDAKQNEDERD